MPTITATTASMIVQYFMREKKKRKIHNNFQQKKFLLNKFYVRKKKKNQFILATGLNEFSFHILLYCNRIVFKSQCAWFILFSDSFSTFLLFFYTTIKFDMFNTEEKSKWTRMVWISYFQYIFANNKMVWPIANCW